MSKRQLHVIDTGYRATLEEQDDPIVWLCHVLRGSGSELDLLLTGNAVVYGVRTQEVEPLRFGGRCQKHAPDLVGDLAGLLGKGATCFYLEEDAAERGVAAGELLEALVPVARAKLPDLFAHYDQVHCW